MKRLPRPPLTQSHLKIVHPSQKVPTASLTPPPSQMPHAPTSHVKSLNPQMSPYPVYPPPKSTPNLNTYPILSFIHPLIKTIFPPAINRQTILSQLPPGLTLKESEIENYVQWESKFPHPYPLIKIGERFKIPEIQNNWFNLLHPHSKIPLKHLSHYHPILDMVVNGLRFHMKSPQIMKQKFVSPFPTLKETDTLLLHKAKTEFLIKGAAHLLTDSTGQPEDNMLWHPSFILHQTSKDRLIVHFSIPTGLNHHIEVEKFKMETIKHLLPLLNEYHWAASFDLRDAYLILHLHPDFKPLSRFKLDEFLLESDTLIFGMSPGPYVYTKLTKEPIALLRHQGIILLIYIDDVIVLGKTQQECNHNLSIAIRLFQSLGWFIKWEKTTEAATQFRFLGWLLDTQKMTISVPLHRVQKIHLTLSEFLKKTTVTLKETSQILGHLTSTSLAIPYIRLLTQKLITQQSWILKQYPPDKVNYQHKIVLLEDTRSDLSELRDNLLNWNHSAIIPSSPNLTFHTDACKSGLGGNTLFQNVMLRIRKMWDWEQLKQDAILGCLIPPKTTAPNANDLTVYIHISILELKAVEETLQMMEFMYPQLEMRNKKILIMTDNISTMVHINKQGGNRCKFQTLLVARILHWCKARNITLIADHIPGKLNVIADFDSRQETPLYHEWQLKKSIFNHICSIWQPSIDLFAEATNFLFLPYVSRLPDPQALAQDAFSFQWSSIPLAWIHPPWVLIDRILAKIFNDQAEALILTPIWPSATWYPRLLTMSCDLPLKICPSHQALFNAYQHDQPPMQTPLAIWRISGKHMFTQELVTTQLKSYWPDIANQPMLITKHISKHGEAGVLHGITIPFHPQSLS